MIYIQMPCKWVQIKPRRTVTPEEIIEKTCNFFVVSKKALEMKDRHRRILTPRQIAMYFIKKYTELSLVEIGKIFGGRDHATVIHAVQTVKDLMDTEEDYLDDIYRLEEKIVGYNQNSLYIRTA